MQDSPVKDNVANQGGSAPKQTVPLADNAPATSDDQGIGGFGSAARDCNEGVSAPNYHTNIGTADLDL